MEPKSLGRYVWPSIAAAFSAILLKGIAWSVTDSVDLLSDEIERNLAAVGWAVLATLLVILLYDQLLFRPIVAWAEKFRFEQTASGEVARSWFLTLVRCRHAPWWCIDPRGQRKRPRP